MTTVGGVGGKSELRRGWPLIVIAAIGSGLGASPLPIFSMGVFTKPIAAAFGWGRGDVQLMLVFFTAGALIGAPAWGAFMDRRGVRPVILASTVGFGVFFALIGLLTQSKATFYAIAFLCALFGAGTTPITWSRAIFEWFSARRGFALGLALMGTGFAAFFVPGYATWLMGIADWRLGFVGLAALPIVISLPLSWWLLRPPPKDPTDAAQRSLEAGVTLRQAVKDYRFYVIAVGFFLVSLGTGGTVTNAVPMLTDRGYDPHTAAWVSGAQGLAVVVGRFVTGYLLDRIWAPALCATVFLLPALACVVLASGLGDMTVASMSIVLVGFAGGAEFDLIAYVTARYFGLKHFGLIYGVLYAIFVSAAGIGPAMFAHSYDVMGNYAFILHVATVCFLVGSGLLLTLGRYPKEYDPNAV